MITMRSLTVTSDGADVFVIYVMEIDVNIVWPMDFSRFRLCNMNGLALSLPRFPFDTNQVEFKLSAFTFHDYKVCRLDTGNVPIIARTTKLQTSSQCN